MGVIINRDRGVGMHDELIDALRNCICMYPDGSCDKCPYDKHPRCSIDMMRDAADAIERLTDEVDRKDKALQAWATTAEDGNAVR